MKAILRNYKVTIPAAIAVLAALSWVAFGYFAIHTAFIDDRVDQAAPVFDAPNSATTTTSTTVSTPATSTATSAPTPATTDVPTTNTPSTPAPVPTVVAEAAGSFVSREHHTSGTVSVLGNGTGQRFLRFEDFETSNGPDVNVYLVNAATGDTSDFVDLGNLQGNIGDQNYEIPVAVDLAKYNTVVIWCVRFSVAFGDAELAAI